MDITKLNDSDFAELTANLVTLLAGTELSAIESHTRADLIAAYGTRPADFVNELTAQAVARDAEIAATSTKNLTRDELEALNRRVQFALKAGDASKDQFDLARLNYPSPRAKAYIAQTPTDMAAVGFSNGVNKGRFQGNNRGSSIVYDVWRREGDTGTWHTHILTRKQTFKDEGIVPGQYYEYRVRALATQNTSDFSNSTVVYGVL